MVKWTSREKRDRYFVIQMARYPAKSVEFTKSAVWPVIIVAQTIHHKIMLPMPQSVSIQLTHRGLRHGPAMSVNFANLKVRPVIILAFAIHHPMVSTLLTHKSLQKQGVIQSGKRLLCMAMYNTAITVLLSRLKEGVLYPIASVAQAVVN